MHAVAAITVGVAVVACAWSTHRVLRLLDVGDRPLTRIALGWGLFLSSFLTVIPVVARPFNSLDAGLIGLAVVSLGAAILLARNSGPSTRAFGAVSPWFWCATAVALGVYAWVATNYQMHDERAIFGHRSMVEQLRRGDYPPYYPAFPEQDARYHYGFDILAGILARAFGLSSDHAIDVVTLVFVWLMCVVAGAITEEVGLPKSAPLAALAIHFGAGLSWLTLSGVEGRHPRCLVQYHHPTCGVDLFPTPFLNVFQHPVSVGVPLAFLAILVASRVFRPGPQRARWAAIFAWILPALAVGQIVYFALGILSLITAWAVLSSRRARGAEHRPSALPLVLALGIGLFASFFAGGMFAASDILDPRAIGFRGAPGFPNSSLGTIAWHHVANLGLGFVLFLPIAYAAIRKQSFVGVALASFAFGGMLVPHFWTYSRSWDIVKFPSAAAFALSLLYVLFIDARLLGVAWHWAWLRRAGRLLLLGGGSLAALFVVVPLPDAWRLYEVGNMEADERVQKAIDWFLSHEYRRDELIYAQSNIAQQLSIFGGLSVVGTDGDTYTLGIKDEVLMRQENLMNQIRATLDAQALGDLKIHWIVLSDEELDNLGSRAREMLKQEPPPDYLELKATFGNDADPKKKRHVWRVKPSTPRAPSK